MSDFEQQVLTALGSLETKVDELQREMRLITERSFKEIIDLRLEMNQGFSQMSARFDAVEDRLAHFDDLHGVLAERDVDQDVEIGRLKRRVARIETHDAPTEQLK
jgi:hypothetical protein